MNLGDYRDELRELEDAGVIELVNSRDGSRVKFTDDGEKAMKFMVGIDTDKQLFIFDLLWTEFYSDIDDPHLRLVKIGRDLRDVAEINIFRTIEARIDDLHGLELTQGSLPEEFVRRFDPDMEDDKDAE